MGKRDSVKNAFAANIPSVFGTSSDEKIKNYKAFKQEGVIILEMVNKQDEVMDKLLNDLNKN